MPGRRVIFMGQTQGGGSSEKTENESSRKVCVDRKRRVRGKEEFYLAVLKCAVGTGIEELL